MPIVSLLKRGHVQPINTKWPSVGAFSSTCTLYLVRIFQVVPHSYVLVHTILSLHITIFTLVVMKVQWLVIILIVMVMVSFSGLLLCEAHTSATLQA